MTIDEFEKLVAKALESLPTEFRQKLDNVQVVVEDWPSSAIAKGRLLLGLYQGVPKTTWGRHLGLKIPDKITIYKGPIEFLSGGDAKIIKKMVSDTVEHEIAHHFGIFDERLREIQN